MNFKSNSLLWIIIFEINLLLISVIKPYETQILIDDDSTTSANNNNNNFWSISFYTGSKFLSGTTTNILIQLTGDLGSSDTIEIKPLDRIRTGSVNKFYFKINKPIGKVASLVIRIQPLVPLIYDWNLFKAEVIDPRNQTYIFYCDCWFKYSFPKRTLYVSKQNDANDTNRIIENSQFSLAVGLLTILTLIVIFAYVSNTFRKRWRNRLVNYNAGDIPLTRTDEPSSNHQVTLSPPESNLNRNYVTTSLLNDKGDNPPEYKDLFPDVSTSNDQNTQFTNKHK